MDATNAPPEPTIPAATKAKRAKRQAEVVPDSNWKKLRASMPPAKKPAVAPASASLVAAAALSSTQTRMLRTGNMHYEHKGIVALDCEMVGDEKKQSMLARVCLINDSGDVLLDEYVRPTSNVKDYRTRYSGILPHHLSPNRALEFNVIQEKMLSLLENKIVVGHGLRNDFEALRIEHPKHLIRDTSHFHRFQTKEGRPRKLRVLALEQLQCPIQEGKKGHDPRIDAKAALDLYLKYKTEWETMLSKRRRVSKSRV